MADTQLKEYFHTKNQYEKVQSEHYFCASVYNNTFHRGGKTILQNTLWICIFTNKTQMVSMVPLSVVLAERPIS